MDYKSLRVRVRKQRKSMRLTQDQLAEKAGISLSFLGHIERGTRKASVETLVALANALGMSTDVLLQESLNDEVLESVRGRNDLRKVLSDIIGLIKNNTDLWTIE